MAQLPSDGPFLFQGPADDLDPAVARALKMFEDRLAEDLDAKTIAREAGVSRSILRDRFVETLGDPPMRYFTRVRMHAAAKMLRSSRENTASIAYSVGFGSEAAFNRAFKREFGQPPAAWRRRVVERERAGGLPRQEVRYCAAHDGTRLAWSAVGSGPPLVKTANWLNHIEADWQSPVWRHWLVELTRGHRLIRYDERGNGLSDWDTPEISFDAFVDDLESVVDAAGLEEFDLLGISQGAAVAIAYSLRHPGRIRRLIIYGGYARGWKKRTGGEDLQRREAMVTLTETGWGADNPAYRQLFTNLYVPDATPEQMQWFNDLQRVSTSPENAGKLQRVFADIDVSALLAKVSVPTLIAHAVNDQVVPFSQGEELAANIPGAAFVPVEGRNHILLESDAGWRTFAAAMADYLGTPREDRPAVALDEKGSCTGADGVRIAYAASGEGFPLVKAPNWITNIETDRSNPSYRHWIDACSDVGRFIRSDMRGFGQSELNPPEFSFGAMVSDLECVVDELGLERFDLLGVAHGSAIAIAYAARHPERVRKLILVNSFAAGWRVRMDPEEIAWRTSLMDMNQREWAFRRSLLGEMFLTLYFPTAGQELIDWHNNHFEELGPTERMQEMIELAADIDVRGEVPKIRAETLVCHSRQDGNAPLAAGRAVADAIDGARWVELDSPNHVLLGNEPAWPVFVSEMRRFLGL